MDQPVVITSESPLSQILRLPPAERDAVLARFGLRWTGIGVIGHLVPRGKW